MADNKRTRSMRPSESPPLEEPADVGLEDTIAPPDEELIALGATVAPKEPTQASFSTSGSTKDHGSEEPPPCPDDADPSLSRGDTVGRYVVLDLLGKGGMGEVYTAYDPELDRRIALKVIHAAVRSGGDPNTAQARLLREAQTLAKLSHPNVVSVYDVGAIEGADQTGDVYVAMEFVEGSDLRAWLESKERSLEEILEIFIAAANGLAAAHDEGLVHRDVKPDNILIGDDGRVRVIDFGIAQQSDPTERRDDDDLVAKLVATAGRRRDLSSGEFEAGSLVGTPAYMTPEQFLGGSAGGQSDQFSLCVALFEAVSGERPFPGKTLPELSSNVLENKRRELNIGPQVPAWLAGALEMGLAPDPEDRHTDMRALAAALVRPEPRRRQATWLFAAIAIIGLGGIGAAYILGGKSASNESCDATGRIVDDTWNDANKERIRSAFASANAEHGNETFLRVRGVLDTYATGWSTARVAACREASSGAMTAATSEKKLACLEGGLRELRAVTTVLATADAALIEEAINTASSISPIERCSNLTRLIAAPVLPAEIDSSLATIKTLERAGRYEQGLKEVEKALTRARELDSELGRARALVWRGRLESLQGEGEASVETLFEAVRTADVVGDTFAAAHAWTYLVYVVGVRLRERHAALRWAKHAEIAIKKDGTPLDLEARRIYHVALANRGLRRYEQALAQFRRATEASIQAFGPGSFVSLVTLMGEAMTMRSLTRLEESVELYQKVIDGMTELLGRENPKLAPVHTNLGIVMVELQRYDEGRSHYQRALDLKRRKLGPEHPSVLVTEMNMAVLEERLGNFKAAADGVAAVHEIRLKRYGDNYPQLPRTLQTQASFALNLGQLREAEAFARRSIDLFSARGDDAHEATASARITLCNIQRLAKRLGDARRTCGRALTSLRAKVEDVRTLAKALSYAANVELDAGRTAIARDLAEEAAKIRDEHPGKKLNHAHTAYVLGAALAADPAQASRARTLAKEATALLAKLHAGDRHLLRSDIETLTKRVGP